MDIWFTSDTHFGHERIIELCDRPYADVDEMNEDLVERWNAVVKPGDRVWHLGDVAMGKRIETLEFVRRLNGDKILIPGNHDNCWDGHKKFGKALHMYQAVGFQICQPPHTITLGQRPVRMSHLPYTGDSHGEERYADHRPINTGHWLICGHVHDSWRVNGRQINVGVDVWDFTPVHEDTLVAIMNGDEDAR